MNQPVTRAGEERECQLCPPPARARSPNLAMGQKAVLGLRRPRRAPPSDNAMFARLLASSVGRVRGPHPLSSLLPSDMNDTVPCLKSVSNDKKTRLRPPGNRLIESKAVFWPFIPLTIDGLHCGVCVCVRLLYSV